MTCVIIVGSQWGDEGKGKTVDLLTEYADGVIRYQGGNNAGHCYVRRQNLRPALDSVRDSERKTFDLG